MTKNCEGAHTHESGRHASLFNGKAKQAQVYPPALCDAICRGLVEQIDMDKRGQFHIASLSVDDAEKGWQKKSVIISNLRRAEEGKPTATEDLDHELQVAWDDVSGAELDAGMVRKARQE